MAEYKLNVPSNGDQFFMVQGRYISSLDQSGGLHLEVDGVSYDGLQTHIAVDHGRMFSRVRLVNTGNDSVTGLLKVSDKPIVDRRPDGEQVVVGSVDVLNWPVSFNFGNFPTSFEVSNFPASFDVGNFPTSFEVSNFPVSFNVSNLPDIEQRGDLNALFESSAVEVGEIVAAANVSRVSSICIVSAVDGFLYLRDTAPPSWDFMWSAFIAVKAGDVLNITEPFKTGGKSIFAGANGAGMRVSILYEG